MNGCDKTSFREYINSRLLTWIHWFRCKKYYESLTWKTKYWWIYTCMSVTWRERNCVSINYQPTLCSTMHSGQSRRSRETQPLRHRGLKGDNWETSALRHIFWHDSTKGICWALKPDISNFYHIARTIMCRRQISICIASCLIWVRHIWPNRCQIAHDQLKTKHVWQLINNDWVSKPVTVMRGWTQFHTGVCAILWLSYEETSSRTFFTERDYLRLRHELVSTCHYFMVM